MTIKYCSRGLGCCAVGTRTAIFPSDGIWPTWEHTGLNDTAECWVLTDGKPGMSNQCVGLAEALGVDFVVKKVRPRLPWRILAPQLWLSPLSAPGADGDSLHAPWPKLLIATGRQTVALSIAIKRASAGKTFTVQIQNPAFAMSRFLIFSNPQTSYLQ